MKNKNCSIKTIFIKRMIYSVIIQCLVCTLILFFSKNYFYNKMYNFHSENLLLNDSFTIDEIARYHLLGNRYALDLELYNLESERKLDSIRFFDKNEKIETPEIGLCNSVNNQGFLVCKTNKAQFSGISPIRKNKAIIGYIVMQKKYYSFFLLPTLVELLLVLLPLLLIFIFNFLFLFFSTRKKIENTTQYLIDFISAYQKNHIISINKIEIDEYRQIAQKFIDEHAKRAVMQKERAYYEVRKNIAEQVAHDIRSPLAAINTVISNGSTLPENKRIVIRNASKRINDIANNLLVQSKHNFYCQDTSSDETSYTQELIFLVLDNIVAEKKYEYFDSKIHIQLNSSKQAYCCFAYINLGIFKRVLSNLINNSIEAINMNGLVILSLRHSDNWVEIGIDDNGCGIPENIIHRVTDQGFSYNKKNGAGIGLSYVKEHIEKMKGAINISSRVNVGTSVRIRLPTCDYPHWFCDSMRIRSNISIVVLDDDPSIHDVWNERLNVISGINVIHFYKASELEANIIDDLNADLFLIDYELLADTQSGLDFIENSNLHSKAILVTSCFEDVNLRLRCKKLNVKIIPKTYVPYIPIITLKETHQCKLILIDDDELVRTSWMLAAESAGVYISTFASPTDFNRVMNEYSDDSAIYM